ncbi:hypothetical protein [Streptomyces sp. MN13]
MRRERGRRRAVAAAVPAAVLLLGGCGIRETDVVEAGGPATVQAFVNPGYDALLFFRSPDGQVSPVIRTFDPAGLFGADYQEGTGQPQPAPTEKVISALLSGPARADEAAGLATSLPRVTSGAVHVKFPENGDVLMVVPVDLAELDTTALRQLICTAAYSRDRDGRATVRMTGRDQARASGTCGLDTAATAAPLSVDPEPDGAAW